MTNRAVWVVESRTPGIRRGAWSQWAPMFNEYFDTRKQALAQLKSVKASHAKCCPYRWLRIVRYVPEVKP